MESGNGALYWTGRVVEADIDLCGEGRAADDLEHVGGGGLLLQRLSKVLVRLAELVGTRFDVMNSRRFIRSPRRRARAARPGRTARRRWGTHRRSGEQIDEAAESISSSHDDVLATAAWIFGVANTARCLASMMRARSERALAALSLILATASGETLGSAAAASALEASCAAITMAFSSSFVGLQCSVAWKERRSEAAVLSRLE
jgi:hypothetical protein